MHYRNVKGILSTKNSMNLYRGCTHGCIYCDSRSKCYNINHDFEDIEIKENAIELLEKTLLSKRKKCMIHTGSMTDPYIPLELEIESFKKSLELIYKYGFGGTLITKSDRVLRDIDLLKKINDKTKFVVQMTLTTADDKLCKLIEPNVSVTSKRVTALKKLNEYGIPTVVWICPILPFINDSIENLSLLLDYCVEANVKGIVCFGMGVTLREGNREYFYDQLDKHFPNLKQKYIKTYGNQYSLTSQNSKELYLLFNYRCKENNILYKINEVFDYTNKFQEKNHSTQISFFD